MDYTYNELEFSGLMIPICTNVFFFRRSIKGQSMSETALNQIFRTNCNEDSSRETTRELTNDQ